MGFVRQIGQPELLATSSLAQSVQQTRWPQLNRAVRASHMHTMQSGNQKD